ncbi:MAG: hypothetical protein HN726_04690 [Candidatus Magasanikbacteria bacterium]|jgi:hypothetical protein|nr:hypothetical protein [Candidatus Magasanikbacteria bacterium]
MAERYRRYTKNITTSSETTIFTVPDDGEGTPGAAETVIIGFLIASTSTAAGNVTVTVTDHYDGSVIKIVDTIPLPADTSIDICPGKLVLQHALNNASTPVLTGDIVKVTSSVTCDVIVSVVERV